MPPSVLVLGEAYAGMKEQVQRILSEMHTHRTVRSLRSGLLLPVLQSVQREFGYIPEQVVPDLALALGVSESHIYGVATFYSHFKFSPPGRNSITVCCGTACHVKGSAMLLGELSKKLGIAPGETTPDGAFSLDAIACFGSCSLAPVVLINRKVHGRVNRAKLLKMVDTLASDDGGPGASAKGD